MTTCGVLPSGLPSSRTLQTGRALILIVPVPEGATVVVVDAVALDHVRTDAFDLREILERLKRTVLLAPRDDRLGLGEADAVERDCERARVGAVDVDLRGGERGRRGDECRKKDPLNEQFHVAGLLKVF